MYDKKTPVWVQIVRRKANNMFASGCELVDNPYYKTKKEYSVWESRFLYLYYDWLGDLNSACARQEEKICLKNYNKKS